jgi:RNA polymerase sigma-70 factor (ECF subfamily)
MKNLRPSIADLIAQSREDADQLGELLERYRAFLLVVGQRQIEPRLAVRSDPSDVVQQTFAEAIEAFRRFKGTTEPEFTAWLCRIHDRNLADLGRRHAVAERRDVRREQSLYASEGSAAVMWNEPAADQSTPSQRVFRGERALQLAGLLQNLPDAQREAVRMRHLEGWPIERIAQEMGKSMSATAGLIKRGLKTLRSKMSEESWM